MATQSMERPSRHRIAALTMATAILVGGAVAWWQSGRSSGREVGVASGSEETLDPVTLLGRSSWESQLDDLQRAAPSEPSGVQTPETVARAKASLRGVVRVVARTGTAPEFYERGEGFVYAVTAAGAKETVFMVPIETSGAYAAEFELPDGADETDLVVGVRVPGYQWKTALQTVRVGSSETLDLVLETGATLRGRVLTRDGQPVVGLDVGAFTSPYRGLVSRTDKLFEDNTARRLARPSEPFYQSWGVTDASGFFALPGLSQRGYTVWSSSPAWFLEQPRQYEPTEEGLELHGGAGRLPPADRLRRHHGRPHRRFPG